MTKFFCEVKCPDIALWCDFGGNPDCYLDLAIFKGSFVNAR